MDADGNLAADPAQTNLDVVRSTISHGRSTVRLTLGMRAIRRSPDAVVGFDLALRTNAGRLAEVDVIAGPGEWRGQHQYIKLRGGSRRCSGITHRIYYGTHRVAISIPRRCLGNPTWIRGASITFRATGLSSEEASDVFVDDALHRTFDGDYQPTATPRLTPAARQQPRRLGECPPSPRTRSGRCSPCSLSPST